MFAYLLAYFVSYARRVYVCMFVFSFTGCHNPVLLPVLAVGQLYSRVAVRVHEHRQVLPVLFHEAGTWLITTADRWRCVFGSLVGNIVDRGNPVDRQHTSYLVLSTNVSILSTLSSRGHQAGVFVISPTTIQYDRNSI